MTVVRKLERERIWSELTAALERESLLTVARRFEVTPGDLAAALRRTKTTRKAITGDDLAAAVPLPDEVREVQADPPSSPALDSGDAPAAPPTSPTPPTAPGATMVEHEERYRAALADGSGDAYLAGVHHLVRIRLRRRLGEPVPTPDITRRARSRSGHQRAVSGHPVGQGDPQPDVRLAPSALESNAVGASHGAAAATEVEATARPEGGHGIPLYAYEITVLLGETERAFAVVERSLCTAIALAVSRTGGEVVRAIRGHAALT